jgi:TolB-like protein
MHKHLRHAIYVGLLSLVLIGCVHDPQTPATSSVTFGSSPFTRGDLGSLTYRAVDLMLNSAPEVTASTPLIVASISDAENMDRSSALGNIVADMIRTRIVQDGRTASEFRLRNSIAFSKGRGDFMLSRNRHALMPAPSASAVVTGTYAVDTDSLYVSLKLVSTADSRIISAADYVVPLQNVWKLLHQSDT